MKSSQLLYIITILTICLLELDRQVAAGGADAAARWASRYSNRRLKEQEQLEAATTGPPHSTIVRDLKALTLGIEDDNESSVSGQLEPDKTGGDQQKPEGCGLQLLRLPTRLVPDHYDLIVMPYLGTLSFEGAVQINLRVRHKVSKSRTGSAEMTPDGQELAANQIVLHADKSLNIDNVWYLDLGAGGSEPITAKQQDKGDRYIEVVNICRDQAFQLLVITLAKDLEPGTRGQLHLTFAGELSDHMRGFYKSAYQTQLNNANNETTTTRYHATTQFQATEARRAFPCFDEPALKSTFDLTLIHPADRISLANMEPIFERTLTLDDDNELLSLAPLSSAMGLNKLKFVRFARTPPMSTYLVAFVVGEFDYVEREIERKVRFDSNGTTKRSPLRVRVYTPIGQSKQGSFALDTASRAIQLMEDYFQIEFPLNKLDMVAIPDFEAGAMENWGLITFKETQLLVDEANSSPETRALVASTVVHEIAHQWFGNLVTMEWWNDLWLNEGFATWMEYKLMEELYPKFDFNYLYLLDSHIHALNEDSFRSAHPIEPPEILTEETRDIDDLFDAISYNKAAAIIRILHDHHLKAQPFRAAIRQYLAAHKYANTNTTDLWQSMESIVQQLNLSQPQTSPVRQFIQSWLIQPGHPLVRVSLLSGSSELSLKQRRFVTNVHKLNKDELKQRWIVPISLLVSDGTGEKQELIEFTMGTIGSNLTTAATTTTTTTTSKQGRNVSGTSTTVKLPVWFNATQPGHWLKLNVNFSGFYRVQYPIELFRLLRAPIERQVMLPIDRLNLVDESHTLMLANMMPTDQLFHLLTWFAREENGAVLDVLVGAYNGLLRIHEHQPQVRRKLELFGYRLFGALYRRKFKPPAGEQQHQVNIEELRHIDKLAQSAMLGTLVHIDYEPAVVEALNVFSASPPSPSVPIHLRRPVYVAVAKRGSDAQFERLFALFNSTESREEHSRLANAMARATQPARLEQVWKWLKRVAKAGGGPDEQPGDKMDMLSSMLVSQDGRKFVRRLLEHEHSKLVQLNKNRPVTNLIEELCISMGSNQFAEMSQLFSRHPNVTDWRLSRDYIKRMLDWQLALQSGGATKRIEAALDDYLLIKKQEPPQSSKPTRRRETRQQRQRQTTITAA